jgi:hypothetical protein
MQWWGQSPWRWLARAVFVVVFTFVALTDDIPVMVVCAWIIVAVNLLFSALYIALWLLRKRQPTEEVAKRLAESGNGDIAGALQPRSEGHSESDR